MHFSKSFYIETFGCQMNISDSEIVSTVLINNNLIYTPDIANADVILLNTCSIRENAEQKVFKRLTEFYKLKKKKPEIIIGIIGCMAERLKEKLLENNYLDLVAGPDAYRNLPDLINIIEENLTSLGSKNRQKAIDTVLSDFETYDDITPYRENTKEISAFISIMRGCENYCSYCVVPSTRGKERSRGFQSIINEAKDLNSKAYKEITLLGQNVNSYKNIDTDGNIVSFSMLIEMIAKLDSKVRIRFTTSHPKDLSDVLLHTIAKYDNICKSIHLPLQSGSNRILKLMNRKYDSKTYLERINSIKTILPDCSISTDIITGFCSETDDDHKDTIKLMEQSAFNFAYMFKYSERPGTPAANKLKDDVPDSVKALRLEEIIKLQQKLSLASNSADMGLITEVLVEGKSKRSSDNLMGRNSQNKVVIFKSDKFKSGDFVNVKINGFTSATLFGQLI